MAARLIHQFLSVLAIQARGSTNSMEQHPSLIINKLMFAAKVSQAEKRYNNGSQHFSQKILYKESVGYFFPQKKRAVPERRKRETNF